MLETTSNGHGSTRDRVVAVLADSPDITPTELGRRLAMPRKSAEYHLRRIRGEPAAKPAAKPAATPVRRPRQPAAKTVTRPRRDPVTQVAVAVVVAVMLAWSYDHITHLAILAGFGWGAWVAPLALDGMAIVSARHLERGQRSKVAWFGLTAGVVGSLAANMLAVWPPMDHMRYVSLAFAALPPLALTVCLHLFYRGNRETR